MRQCRNQFISSLALNAAVARP